MTTYFLELFKHSSFQPDVSSPEIVILFCWLLGSLLGYFSSLLKIWPPVFFGDSQGVVNLLVRPLFETEYYNDLCCIVFFIVFYNESIVPELWILRYNRHDCSDKHKKGLYIKKLVYNEIRSTRRYCGYRMEYVITLLYRYLPHFVGTDIHVDVCRK